VDWAVPILQEPLQIVDGMAIVANRAGNGMVWDEAAVAKFKLD
jgi:mandelate racemase